MEFVGKPQTEVVFGLQIECAHCGAERWGGVKNDGHYEELHIDHKSGCPADRAWSLPKSVRHQIEQYEVTGRIEFEGALYPIVQFSVDIEALQEAA